MGLSGLHFMHATAWNSLTASVRSLLRKYLPFFPSLKTTASVNLSSDSSLQSARWARGGLDPVVTITPSALSLTCLNSLMFLISPEGSAPVVLDAVPTAPSRAQPLKSHPDGE